MHHTCDGMDKQPCVSYAESNDAYTVDESFTQIDLPPGIERKYPLCHVIEQDGTQSMINKMRVLHHVRYIILYPYIEHKSYNILTYMHIYE